MRYRGAVCACNQACRVWFLHDGDRLVLGPGKPMPSPEDMATIVDALNLKHEFETRMAQEKKEEKADGE